MRRADIEALSNQINNLDYESKLQIKSHEAEIETLKRAIEQVQQIKRQDTFTADDSESDSVIVDDLQIRTLEPLRKLPELRVPRPIVIKPEIPLVIKRIKPKKQPEMRHGYVNTSLVMPQGTPVETAPKEQDLFNKSRYKEKRGSDMVMEPVIKLQVNPTPISINERVKQVR